MRSILTRATPCRPSPQRKPRVAIPKLPPREKAKAVEHEAPTVGTQDLRHVMLRAPSRARSSRSKITAPSASVRAARQRRTHREFANNLLKESSTVTKAKELPNSSTTSASQRDGFAIPRAARSPACLRHNQIRAAPCEGRTRTPQRFFQAPFAIQQHQSIS